MGTFDESMRLKEHSHIFVNTGGKLGALDFRMGGVGAPFNGLKAFATTEQLGVYDKVMNAVRYLRKLPMYRLTHIYVYIYI